MVNEINFEFLSRAFFNITCMMHEYILIITNNEGLTSHLPFLISSRINCSRCSTLSLPFASTSTSLYYHIYQCNYMFVLISTLNELFTSTVNQVHKNSFSNSFTNTVQQVTDTIHQVTNTVQQVTNRVHQVTNTVLCNFKIIIYYVYKYSTVQFSSCTSRVIQINKYSAVALISTLNQFMNGSLVGNFKLSK